MANEIKTTPRISLRNGELVMAVGLSFQQIDQATAGSTASSDRISTTPQVLGELATMGSPGVCLLQNLSNPDAVTGDPDFNDGKLHLQVGATPVTCMILNPGEQFSFRFNPAETATYSVAASVNNCNYSLTTFED